MTNASDLADVPLFPLPNVVLFPRAVLPLHIFEARYRTMIADALAGDRTIAIGLLRPGWEMHYYERPAIDRVVCVGTITEHRRLPDGRYNILLQGASRAVVEHEWADEQTTYRRAGLSPLVGESVMEIDLSNDRQRLTAFFSETTCQCLSTGRHFLQMLTGSMSTEAIADLIAFTLFDDATCKQKLLAEPNPRRRVAKVLATLETMRSSLTSDAQAS